MCWRMFPHLFLSAAELKMKWWDVCSLHTKWLLIVKTALCYYVLFSLLPPPLLYKSGNMTKCSFARETTLDLWVSRLIGLNLNVFQTAPGAYGRMKPSRGEREEEREKQSWWKKVQKVFVCFFWHGFWKGNQITFAPPLLQQWQLKACVGQMYHGCNLCF